MVMIQYVSISCFNLLLRGVLVLLLFFGGFFSFLVFCFLCVCVCVFSLPPFFPSSFLFFF